jgi:2-polyprenyl-3-methyl-5-hydroxy-6-metoxy-1,4-benzoquinol methylase
MGTFKNVVAKIETLDPLHSKKIRKDLEGFDDAFYEKADLFTNRFADYLKKKDKSLDYGIDCYLKMIADVRVETMHFARTGEYTSKSFDEVNKRVYNNPEVMEYYMNGLLLSQFLWGHHYSILNYFTDNLSKYRDKVDHYLEMGGGHGLYISQAISLLKPGTKFDLIDISPTSIEASRSLINNDAVNYTLSDIFKVKAEKKYDFITMGEVMEHVEDPIALLKKLGELLKDGGSMFVTTPTNAPAIDHIYLFKNAEDIRDVIDKAGFRVTDEIGVYSEKVSKERAEKYKVAMLYAAFITKK